MKCSLAINKISVFFTVLQLFAELVVFFRGNTISTWNCTQRTRAREIADCTILPRITRRNPSKILFEEYVQEEAVVAGRFENAVRREEHCEVTTASSSLPRVDTGNPIGERGTRGMYKGKASRDVSPRLYALRRRSITLRCFYIHDLRDYVC